MGKKSRKNQEKIAESYIHAPKNKRLALLTRTRGARFRSNEAVIGHTLRTKVVVLGSRHEALALALIDTEEDLSTDLGTQENRFLGSVSASRGAAGA